MSRLVVVVLLALGLSALTVSLTRATSDSIGAASFHPFTLENCVPWTEPSGRQVGNCDPVDLVFPGMTWQQARDLLLSRGWTTAGAGSNQQLHFLDENLLVTQSVQLFFAQGFSARYHVRLWQVPGQNPPVTLGAVHHEAGVLSHSIDMDWDAAEAYLANQVCGSNCAKTPQLTQQLAIQATDADGDASKWRGWRNDGRATIIEPAAATSTRTPSPTPTRGSVQTTPTRTPTPFPSCPTWAWWCRR